jgi:hypothetical protein
VTASSEDAAHQRCIRLGRAGLWFAILALTTSFCITGPPPSRFGIVEPRAPHPLLLATGLFALLALFVGGSSVLRHRRRHRHLPIPGSGLWATLVGLLLLISAMVSL